MRVPTPTLLGRVCRRTGLALLLPLSGLMALPAVAASLSEVDALLKIRSPEALPRAEAAVAAAKSDALAWILLTRAQLQNGRADDALDSAEEAVELAPNSAQAHFWLGNSLGVRIGQVNMLRKMGMAPDLRDAFETAVRLDPNLLEARTALIQFYLQAPSAIGGGVDKATAQVAEIARRNPVRGHLAQASLDRFNKDDAAMNRSIDAAAAAAASLPAADVDSRTAVMLNLVALERYAQAHGFVRAWAQAQPDVAAPHYQMGRLAAISGQFGNEGAASLKRYLEAGLTRAENDARETHAWWRLGQIEAQRGDVAAARTAFQTALRLDPTNTEAKKSLQAL